ncbi:hypothetical protein BT67DRAFT_443685 [Trichocladium antarcticum]|uniref:Uncharacterized protein n=1 Tax=Trichocladium antarcticum TaxID=1450529 RepID=A0AAN6UGU4_9PEZI|nr:hypothetical protein BT67DRAFT_443685 [Trichocladium antarcticum]
MESWHWPIAQPLAPVLTLSFLPSAPPAAVRRIAVQGYLARRAVTTKWLVLSIASKLVNFRLDPDAVLQATGSPVLLDDHAPGE